MGIFDQRPLIFVVQRVAIIKALVLDEVRTRVHFQELLQQGRLEMVVGKSA
jgi:hypothetical protein